MSRAEPQPSAEAPRPGGGLLVVGLPVATAALAAYFGSGWGGAAARLQVFWAAMLLLDVVLVAVSVGVARSLPAGPARAFWRALSFASAVFMVGDVGSAFAGLRYLEWPQGLAILQAVGLSSGLLTVLVTMLRHPVRWRSGRARLAFWLDTGTVSVGAAAFSWFLVVRPGSSWSQIALALVTAAVFVLTTFAGARLAVSDDPPVVWPAAVLLVTSVGVISVANLTLPIPDLANADVYGLRMLVWLLPALLGVAGVLVQRRTGWSVRRAARGRWRRRSYSLLPYLTLAAVFGLLLVSLPQLLNASGRGVNAQAVGVLSAVLLSVALVVARQLVAFTDNDRLLAQLGRQEQRMSALLEHSSDITTITGADLRVTYVSPAAERILGYRAGALHGRSAATFLHPQDRAQVEAPMRALLATPGRSHTHQARYRHADGTWRWLEVITTNLIDAPHVGGLISNSREVTAARELQQLLQHQASHDPLTQLANRSLFGERLEEALAPRPAPAAQAPGAAVLAIDLDDFKGINDTLGHHAGDAALVGLAERLRSCLRTSDTAARLGGDEFAVLLPGADAAEAVRVADRVLHALREPVPVDGHPLHLRVSIGVAGSAGPDPDEVLRAADAAMYRAKQAGKSRYVVHRAEAAAVGPDRRA
ncbi:hypothetical protein GCM10010124_32870 [Pilimelia terevasa]|uniref:Diguanylate cyclase n=1 Tax=Pilimelia terevasa TaxID=53372 RepID=A0A8J3FLS5_9ACTN|nr:sensor domain-containing diguanylate cyclase [Pilimelia terevasa]GGK37492.1 hypothetical protein GCM10010124_32870 [Pilimelia terevasa]